MNIGTNRDAALEIQQSSWYSRKKNKVAGKIGEIKRSRFVYKPNFWSWGKVWRFLLAPAHAHSLGTELQLQSMASINLSRAAVVALLFGRISHA